MNEDNKLIERTLRGEKRAFEMIIRKYQQPLFNYIGRMVNQRELALDFTQEVFIKTYASLPSYNPQYKFSTWLFKIASNLIIDYWRKRKIKALSLDQQLDSSQRAFSIEVPDYEPSVAKKFELTQLREKILAALEKIPPLLRELFLLRHVNDFSYEEIADIKNLPIGTVKNKVFQAKELIRQLLKEKI